MENIKSVLVALRRIMRATDIHSRYLIKHSGLTMPQLILMQALSKHSNSSISELAKLINLSQATVTTIVFRLEKQFLIERKRDTNDKRRFNLMLTKKGKTALKNTPTLMQEQFINRFGKLELWEQTQIISTLQRVAHMMDANDIDASPILQSGPIPQPLKP